MRQTLAQKVQASRAGRELAAAGVVSVHALDRWPGGWVLTFADGTERHSDNVQVRFHNTLAALSRS